MTWTVLLDSTLLSLVTNPKSSPESERAVEWLEEHRAAGSRILVPAIIDYELRRVLVHEQKINGLKNLNEFTAPFSGVATYLPLTDASLRKAAELWAHARSIGVVTAPKGDLDVDVILCGQAASLDDPDAIVVTANVRHLDRLVRADHWENIRP